LGGEDALVNEDGGWNKNAILNPQFSIVAGSTPSSILG
jgi:hypothetical protein